MKSYSDVAKVTIDVNGEERSVHVRPADTLLRALREKWA